MQQSPSTLLPQPLQHSATGGGRRQTAIIPCPKQTVGRVIGRNGETIKALQIYSGALIQIDQTVEPTKIAVSGTPQCLNLALSMINDIIRGTFKGFALLRQATGQGSRASQPVASRPVYAPGYGLIPPSQLYGVDDTGGMAAVPLGAPGVPQPAAAAALGAGPGGMAMYPNMVGAAAAQGGAAPQYVMGTAGGPYVQQLAPGSGGGAAAGLMPQTVVYGNVLGGPAAYGGQSVYYTPVNYTAMEGVGLQAPDGGGDAGGAAPFYTFAGVGGAMAQPAAVASPSAALLGGGRSTAAAAAAGGRLLQQHYHHHHAAAVAHAAAAAAGVAEAVGSSSLRYGTQRAVGGAVGFGGGGAAADILALTSAAAAAAGGSGLTHLHGGGGGSGGVQPHRATVAVTMPLAAGGGAVGGGMDVGGPTGLAPAVGAGGLGGAMGLGTAVGVGASGGPRPAGGSVGVTQAAGDGDGTSGGLAPVNLVLSDSGQLYAYDG